MEEKNKEEKGIAPRPASPVQVIETNLVKMIEQRAKALPAGFNQTRFIQNCLAVLADAPAQTPALLKCKPMSIARALVKGAYLDLDFFRKECYAIPYGDECNFQTDYKGEVKLVKKYGRDIQDVYAKLVREGDALEIYIENGKQIVNFRPLAFNDNEIKGAFAVVVFADGSTRFETMSTVEIEDVRKKYSKAPNSPAWIKSPGEMYKKTVLRRLCKLIDLHFDTLEQAKAYEEGGDADFKRGKGAKAAKQGVDDALADAPAVGQLEPPVEAEIKPVDQPAADDPDAKLEAELRAQYPNEKNWQIEARMKEAKGEV